MDQKFFKKYKIKAKKALGQNFLVNEEIVTEIAETIEVGGKNIVEVGPGYGALTEKLINHKPKTLNLIEIDLDMIKILEDRQNVGDFNLEGIKFNIYNIDVLKYKPNEKDNYSVIANIPYYITSPILRHFLYSVENKPENMVILMQKDVGDKIISGQVVGKKGKVRSSVLSLFISKKAYVTETIKVAKENFIPAPKVESSVLLFESHDKYSEIDDEQFLEVIKKGFGEPRKKLLKNFIKSGYEKDIILDIFNKLSIDTLARGEDLDIVVWCNLISEINKKIVIKTGRF